MTKEHAHTHNEVRYEEARTLVIRDQVASATYPFLSFFFLMAGGKKIESPLLPVSQTQQWQLRKVAQEEA